MTLLVVLPQVVRIVMPGMINACVSIIKEPTVVLKNGQAAVVVLSPDDYAQLLAGRRLGTVAEIRGRDSA